MRRDKRGLSAAIGMACARNSAKKRDTTGDSDDSDDDAVVVEISSESDG
eukprot:COSAG04_NODE_22426_length_355_cov_0.773438_2_plen_48_part_01